jgi:hypothetical protein
MEAMRMNAGLPVYEPHHATHLYGPLLTVALAGIFRVIGLNLLAARSLFCGCAIGLAILMSSAIVRSRLHKYWLGAFFLFLAVNFRTDFILLTIHPDAPAALLAVSGLCLWVGRRHSRWRALLSIGLFVAAMLFKQTSAALTLIPPVHVLLWERPFRWRKLIASFLPLACVVMTLCLICFTWPELFRALVSIPASIHVFFSRSLSANFYLFGTFPIFLISCLTLFMAGKRIDARERWVLSATVVLIPTSIWTFIKSGGGHNSLLFAYLAMTALAILQFDKLFRLGERFPRGRIFLASLVILFATFWSFFFGPRKSMAFLLARSGDDCYPAAVEVARRAGPVLVTPQDPTIAFRANGYFGRSLFFELDTHAIHGEWPVELPEGMRLELAQASSVIEVKSFVPTPVFGRGLSEAGFRPMAVPELKNSAYILWQRSNTGETDRLRLR